MLLLQRKTKQNAGCPNKEYNAIFEHIHQNIRAYLRCKKNLHRSMIDKISLHIGKNQRKARRRWISVVCYRYSYTVWGWYNYRKTLQYLLSFKREKFEFLYKHIHFLFSKISNLISNWVTYENTASERLYS